MKTFTQIPQTTNSNPRRGADTVDAANPRLDTLGERPPGRRDEIRKRLGRVLETDNNEDHLGRVAHYNLIEVLGHGGSGIVVKAFDERLLRPVAIKFLAPERAHDSFVRHAFIREARVAAAVRHPGVVQIHAVENSPVPYIVMEYVDGRTLHEYIDDHGAMEFAQIVDFGEQISAALTAAHDLGIIHRDIKPANILLTNEERPRVKLADFGTARTEHEVSLAMSGFYAGTPTFMSPEQLSNHDVDQRTDLFSLGSVLYMMATGSSPFAAGSIMSVLHQISYEQPEPISRMQPDLPAGFCDLISRMHAKSPHQRPANAGEISAALSGFSADRVASLAGQRPVKTVFCELFSTIRRRIRSATAKPFLNRKSGPVRHRRAPF